MDLFCYLSYYAIVSFECKAPETINRAKIEDSLFEVTVQMHIWCDS